METKAMKAKDATLIPQEYLPKWKGPRSPSVSGQKTRHMMGRPYAITLEKERKVSAWRNIGGNHEILTY